VVGRKVGRKEYYPHLHKAAMKAFVLRLKLDLGTTEKQEVDIENRVEFSEGSQSGQWLIFPDNFRLVIFHFLSNQKRSLKP
jgi:hypothetical protein